MEKNTKTVLIIGATSNIGVAAILDALGSDRNFLAVVRDQHSIKVLEHVPTGYDRITVVESDAVSDQGVQNIVAKTTCTGSQGDIGYLTLPAISQGALFSIYYSAYKALAGTNVRFNEIYLGRRVQVDSVAEQAGSTKSSTFGRVCTNILGRADIKSCRVRVENEADVDELKLERKA
ncbi:hypothetical protein COCC4DRAFT_45051 [Bipolaris maydis ATCC 48331]|uniref:NAD(P)-binding domain-containing protein n=2 Tax=Cochliobolus heterostrophus TaxID=5016 RepID=M2SVZ6_COCH5|nr:uncharacterized protein COCC4DRAFT_45051 [Bipolaris maydis ATCC 48331]EMD89520.1 hypothetical protein COCHEDRAFT_1216242 [Bipolaris maydis C5]KAH7552838.1 hypothetical protein BM1_08789 [Bipolaris maydis]ENH99774.1 hypothetical protein COCC4DRAFT_45051 [Bipolaris maydis ATCC 48331]KAJ5025132.1 hypothetical protein J3E73DRAFT_392380 [Bipolaris maydis]KAJ6212865.1 hypothetical protein PSV09DRAFT_1216242 [Bipolaris maydis]